MSRDLYRKQKRCTQTRLCAPEENENFSVAELTRPLCQHAHSGPLLCKTWLFMRKRPTNLVWCASHDFSKDFSIRLWTWQSKKSLTRRAELFSNTHVLLLLKSEIKTKESCTIKWLVSPHFNSIIQTCLLTCASLDSPPTTTVSLSRNIRQFGFA